MRLTQGRFEDSVIYGDDPLAMAKRWESQGAEWLHVVDLDGAKAGAPVQRDLVAKIASEAGIPVQTGGGYRDLEEIQKSLDSGIARVILGSVAIKRPDLAKEAFERFGDQVVLGLDAKDGKAAAQGWLDVADDDAFALASEMEKAGAKRIIFTDIGRDGMLSGVNLDATGKLIETVGIPVIASGGVGSLSDLDALLALPGRGAEGVIIGKAIYGGAFSIREALDYLHSKPA